MILSHQIKEKDLLEKTFSKKENKNVSISIAKKGTKLKIVELAIKNAKESLNRKIYESQNNKNFFEEIVQKFNLHSNISLIEVYDNNVYTMYYILYTIYYILYTILYILYYVL